MKSSPDILTAQTGRKAVQNSRLPEVLSVSVSILLISLLTCYPFLHPGLSGYAPDYTYHLLRIKGLSEALRQGHYPVRIYTDFFGGMGYGSPMFYPDLFLIPAALLHLSGFSLLTAYKAYAFIFVMLAALSSYLSLRHVTKSRPFSLLGTWLLCLSQFYLADLMVRNGYSGYFAYIFIPVLLAGIYDYFRLNGECVWMIGLGLSGLLLCHTINAFLGLLLTVFLFLFQLLVPGNRKLVFEKKRFQKLLITAALTVGITGFYLFPLLEQMTSGVDFNVFHPWANVGEFTQPFADFFDLTGSFFNIAHVGIGVPVFAAMLLSFVLLLRQAALCLRRRRSGRSHIAFGEKTNTRKTRALSSPEEENAVEKGSEEGSAAERSRDSASADRNLWGPGLFLLGILLFLSMTRLVPWEKLSHTVFNDLQFTFRIYPYALSVLVFGMMLIFTEHFSRRLPGSAQRWLTAGFAALCVIFAVLQNQTVMNGSFQDVTDETLAAAGAGDSVGKGEWLPSGFDPETMITEQVAIAENPSAGTTGNNRAEDTQPESAEPYAASFQDSDSGNIPFLRSAAPGGSFSVKAAPAGKTFLYDVPVIYYKGYRAALAAEDGSTEDLPVTSGENGLVLVENSTGKAGEIRVFYKDTPVQLLSWIITVLTAAGILTFCAARVRIGSVSCPGTRPDSEQINHHDFRLFLLYYSLAYLVLACSMLFWFLVQNKSMINTSDAYEQHINALLAFGKWLRGIWYELRTTGRLNLQTYSFGLGYGADFYTSLQYYAIGDPLNLPVGFLPSSAVYYYYQFLILLRPWLAGLAFGRLCFYRIFRDRPVCWPVLLAGSLSYSFCGTVLFLGMWNPFFVNSMILLPLLILGIEKILAEGRPACFILSVFWAGIANFYFFYVLVILTILYGVIRVIFFCRGGRDGTDRENRSGLQRHSGSSAGSVAISAVRILLRLLLYGVTGALMAMVILLPVVIAFLGNPRASSGNSVSLLYPLSYYRELIQNLTAYLYHPLYDTEIGLNFLAVPALILLLLRAREHRMDAVIGTGLLLMLLIPIAGYGMNGFAYMINRWSFAVSLFLCWLMVDLWDELFSLTGKEKLILTAGTSAYLILALLSGRLLPSSIGTAASATEASARNFAASLILLAAGTAVILAGNGRRHCAGNAANAFRRKNSTRAAGSVLALLTGSAVALNIYYADSRLQGNLPAGFLDRMTGEEFVQTVGATEVPGIEALEGGNSNRFLRYSGRNLVWNASLSRGVSSTQFYWSLANRSVSDFFEDMAVNEMANYSYFGLDDRAALLGLTSSDLYSLRYDTAEERRYVPAGYVPAGNYYNFAFYRSDYALPLGYTCDRIVPEAQYRAMTPVQRQEALLHGAYLSERDQRTAEKAAGSALPVWEPSFSGSVIPCEMELNGEIGDITVQETAPQEAGRSAEASISTDFSAGSEENAGAGYRFDVSSPGASVTFSFQGLEQSETYLFLSGMQYAGGPDLVNLTVTETVPEGIPAVTKTISFKQPRSQFYAGWDTYLVNLGYLPAAVTGITLTFPEAGTYSFDSIQVICQPAAGILAGLAERHANTMANVNLHKNPVSFTTDTVTGEIDLASPQILVLTIPWQRGWTLYDNGGKTDLFQTDTMFTGALLPAGHHQLELHYETPGLKAGALLSLLGFLLFLYLCRKSAGPADTAPFSRHPFRWRSHN